MASGGWVLDTVVRVTETGSRPQTRAAAAMRARIVASRSAKASGVDGGREAGDEAGMNEPETTEDGARLWAVAQALARAADAVRGGVPSRAPSLLFFTDPERTPRPWEIAATLPAGSGVVYRAFGASGALEQGLRLRAVTRARGLRLLVGLDPELGDRLEADGLHLPERALSAAYALSGRRPDWILTGAVHSAKAALAGRNLDAVVLSPVFPAGGRSAVRPPLGVEALGVACSGPTRVIAMGGVMAENASHLIGTGAAGLAAIGGLSGTVAD